jgi:hypothetical protein
MLKGRGNAFVSSSVKGVTFGCARYEKKIRGSTYVMFDTAGLNETDYGSVPAHQQLYKLMRQLEGGLTLLVYVMRAPRLKSSSKANYEVFYRGFCQSGVPIIIIITGLEHEPNMDKWWEPFRLFGQRHEFR